MLRHLSFVLAAASVVAQSTPELPERVSITHSVGIETVADGVIAGEGADYRAEFSRHGMRFVPALGTAVAVNQHVTLRPLSASRNGEPLFAMPTDVAPRRGQLEVVYDRAAGVSEHFDIRPEGVELSWRLAQRPVGDGDLVVRYAIETNLPDAIADGDGCAFVLPSIGGVTIGGVTGIDARGHAVRGELHCDGQLLELSLPADFVDNAAYPIVLDPLVGTRIDVQTNGSNDTDPDVCHGRFNGTWLVAWRRVFSIANAAVRCQRLTSTGALSGSTIFLNSAGVAGRPRVAYLDDPNRFGIVWQREVNGISSIEFAAVSGFDGSITHTQQIDSSTTANTLLDPDIGCDVMAAPNSARGFAVVYEDDNSNSIRGRRIDFDNFDNLLMGSNNALFVDGAGMFGNSYNQPAISRAAGPSGALLVVVRDFSPLGPSSSIRCMRIFSNTVTAGPIDTVYASFPESSWRPDVDGYEGQWVVCWEKQNFVGTDYPEVAVRTVKYDASGQFSTEGLSVAGGVAAGNATHPTVGYSQGRTYFAYRNNTSPVNVFQIYGIDSGSSTPCGFDYGTIVPGNETRIVVATQNSGWSIFGESALAVFGEAGDIYAQRLINHGTSGTTQNLGGGCGNAGVQTFGHEPGIGSNYMLCRLGSVPTNAIASIFNFTTSQATFPCGACEWAPFEATIIDTTYILQSAAVGFPIPCLDSLIGAQFVTQWTTLLAPSPLPGQTPCSLFPDIVLSDRSLMTIGN